MSTARPSEALDAVQVMEYLRRHPDFLVNNPEAVLLLAAPGRDAGDAVIDLQKVMLERMRDELARLKSTQRKLIATNRVNLQTQGRVHSAVLAMIEAPGLDHLIHTVTHDLAMILDLDVVSVAVEASDPAETAGHVVGLQRLASGSVDRLIGEGRDTRLRPDAQGEAEVFGSGAGLVRSDALVRIKVSAEAPVGLIAFGSRRESTFHPSQGTDLLAFLARAFEISVRAWLAPTS